MIRKIFQPYSIRKNPPILIDTSEKMISKPDRSKRIRERFIKYAVIVHHPVYNFALLLVISLSCMLSIGLC